MMNEYVMKEEHTLVGLAIEENDSVPCKITLIFLQYNLIYFK